MQHVGDTRERERLLVAAENERSSKGGRVMPRISAATGGLKTGVDLATLSTLQEAEDLEYVAHEELQMKALRASRQPAGYAFG
jgi:hypothetical protein